MIKQMGNVDYKIILGVAATIVGLFGYYPYLRDLMKGVTKPHAFSWLIWGTMEVIAFLAQISRGGGTGTWVTGISALITLFIAFKAFRLKDKDITAIDWLALSGALIGIVLWMITDNPLTAVVCITVADALGFVPTFRKGFDKPFEETLFEYTMSAIKWTLGIVALQALSPVTWLYPASLVMTNSTFVIMALIRRKHLGHRWK